ncbi:MAG: family N-acetyltransferase, partial [Clostridia bacterium]|nr:family N-acetyltransferase [Clostridia bacterium]
MSMIKLQDHAQITRVHFTAPFSYFVIESVIEGNTYGEIFVDKLDNPQITIVWDTKYSINCGGSADKDVLRKAVEFIKSDILTDDVRQDRGIVKIMYENKEWEQALLEGVQGFNYDVYPRSVYRHELEQIPNLLCKGEGITIKKLDEELVNNHKLKNHEGLIEELIQMWGSLENFLSKGFGYCAITKD